jgi:micrococcal nuclease
MGVLMYEYYCVLDRVVDGDTVDVIIDLGFDIHFKQRIRLYGIDAPESRTKDLEEKKKGLASTDRLIELLPKSPERFTVKTTLDKKGKYGRILGTFFVENDNINDILIEEGHAVRY